MQQIHEKSKIIQLKTTSIKLTKFQLALIKIKKQNKKKLFAIDSTNFSIHLMV